MGKVMYCERCGHVGYVLFSKKCKQCNIKKKILPEEIKYKYHIFVEDWSRISYEEILQREEEFVMNELANNPLFSLDEHKKQVQAYIESVERMKEYDKQQILKRQAKNLEKMQKENIKITCPYCKSTNTSKITVASKAVHTAAFGVYSISRNSKQWHCNKCGSDF